MDKELFRQTAEACKMVTEHFGVDVIADQKRFCSAFSDFAPKLSKEKKAFNLALSENVGAFFLREHENVTSGKKSADSIIKRAVTDLSDYLNEEKAELVVKSLAYALGWEFTSAEPEKEVESSDISAFSSGSTLIEELFSKAKNGDNDACGSLLQGFVFFSFIKAELRRLFGLSLFIGALRDLLSGQQAAAGDLQLLNDIEGRCSHSATASPLI